MKRFFSIFFSFIALFCSFCFSPPANKSHASSVQKPMMCIVIDDYGSYDQSGVKILARCTEPLTCAVLPNTDFSEDNSKVMKELGHEIILHLPMESHVNLPQDWYGPTYIKNSDTPENVCLKLENFFKQFPDAKGFNTHIGSGVSQNQKLMETIYTFAKEHGLYFLDSRTIETKATENACKNTQSIYLRRDVFLEADKNKSYQGVRTRLFEGVTLAKENGFSIVIGHVGAEGGENTAKAIVDAIPQIKDMGIDIVPLSKIYEHLKTASNKV